MASLVRRSCKLPNKDPLSLEVPLWLMLFSILEIFFVWVDETGGDQRDQIHKFGYALKGITPIYDRLLVRGTRISSIAAMCSEELVEYHLTNGTVNGEVFFYFVRYQLPNMQPFPNERSIVVLDNCTIVTGEGSTGKFRNST